ncbi:MAG: bifunctional DNA-formamidopyrimidine glycosylase/DNA-(apurinic or apyrimidinic site) lyase [Pseudomonadota bacterium]
MPELPEVETVLRGLTPHVTGKRLLGARVREPRLRWPVTPDLHGQLAGCQVQRLERRGKYLLLELVRTNPDQPRPTAQDAPGYPAGRLIIHLGMSGSLRLCQANQAPGPHDHVDILLEGGQCLRLKDPRRFGAMLLASPTEIHPLLSSLGVEPLGTEFDGNCLYQLSRGRRIAIKSLLMDAHKVVGIGNIYANEALFHAGIDPRLGAGRLSRPRCERLAGAIQDTLRKAIEAGGSSLRDFVNGHGQPGYFQQTYYVYGRTGQPCRNCGTAIRHLVQGGRSTYLCPHCQTR